MDTNERNPSPTNSGEPHLWSTSEKEDAFKGNRTNGSGRGALILGQSAKGVLAGEVRQGPDPPPQFSMPDEPIREAPIKTITLPV